MYTFNIYIYRHLFEGFSVGEGDGGELDNFLAANYTLCKLMYEYIFF